MLLDHAFCSVSNLEFKFEIVLLVSGQSQQVRPRSVGAGTSIPRLPSNNSAQSGNANSLLIFNSDIEKNNNVY